MDRKTGLNKTKQRCDLLDTLLLALLRLLALLVAPAPRPVQVLRLELEHRDIVHVNLVGVDGSDVKRICEREEEEEGVCVGGECVRWGATVRIIGKKS